MTYSTSNPTVAERGIPLSWIAFVYAGALTLTSFYLYLSIEGAQRITQAYATYGPTWSATAQGSMWFQQQYFSGQCQVCDAVLSAVIGLGYYGAVFITAPLALLLSSVWLAVKLSTQRRWILLLLALVVVSLHLSRLPLLSQIAFLLD